VVHLSSLCTEQTCLFQTVERILSKCAGNVLLLTISVKDYILSMFTHHVYACKRERESARMVNTFRYLWTDSFQICWANTTTRYMGYIRIMFTHRGHTHERACASAHVIICSLIYGRFLLTFAVNILQLARATYFSCSRTTRASARV
jgi:hypothetical protein